MNRILVTGGAGYLSSVLIGKLLEQGHSVVAYDNLMYNQTSLLQYISNKNFSFVFGDVEDDTEILENLILNSDIVLPFACIVGAPASSRELNKSAAVNEMAIMNLVECCLEKNPKIKIIYPTTNSGYGTTSGEVYCDESTPLDPISPYGKQKVSAELYLMNNYENAISLRLATVFGVSSRMRLDLLVNFTVNKAVNDRVICVPKDIAQNIRNYVHVLDVADAFIHCINNFEFMKGESYNLGNDDENKTVLQLSEQIAEIVGCEIAITNHYKDLDKRNYIISNQKLKDTGFEAKRTIKDEIPNLLRACEMIKFLQYGRSVFKNA